MELDEGQRTIVCVHCEHSRQDGWQRRCDETGRVIQEHAREAACPHERYVAVNLPPAARTGEKAGACVKASAPRPWPWRVRIVALWRRPGDAGVGDTATRLIGPLGVTFEEAYEWIVGRPCRCGSRRAKLNRMYPYAGDGRAATTAV